MVEEPLSIKDVVDTLSGEAEIREDFIVKLNSSKSMRTRLHGNTYLLEMLCQNQLQAAEKLINLDTGKYFLNIEDRFPTCRNTPLIFAAKIHANSVLIKLIEQGADLNKQDYRGFTALHYACIYRNTEAIEALLIAGARKDLATCYFQEEAGCLFPKKKKYYPIDYYNLVITEEDLEYAYGLDRNGDLNQVWDWDESYFGTKKKSLSALRWFIGYIAINKKFDISDSDKTNINQNICRTHDASLYKKLMNLFLQTRPELNQNILNELTLPPSKTSDYIWKFWPRRVQNSELERPLVRSDMQQNTPIFG